MGTWSRRPWRPSGLLGPVLSGKELDPNKQKELARRFGAAGAAGADAGVDALATASAKVECQRLNRQPNSRNGHMLEGFFP